MSILKGFAEISTLIDNSPNTVSTVGELSADSKTYVKDYLTYTHSSYQGSVFLSMQSLDDNFLSVTPTSIQTQACLEIISFVQSKAITGEIGPTKNSFIQLFELQFAGRFKVLYTGDHVANETNWYPGSVSFCPIGNHDKDNWTVWFADASFSHEFDITVIHVIPPIVNLDQFFNTPNTVKDLLASMSRSGIMERVEEVRGDSPYTLLRMDPFNWVDPNDVTIEIETYWNIVIYGRAGNNLDSVKEAIVNHILANSARTVEDWSTIFPDIFKSTEIIIAPGYHIQGVPEQNFERGMYTAISNLQDSLVLMKSVTKGNGYTKTHIENKATIIPTLYRSATVTLITGPENRVGYENFRDLYWDYVNVPTTHIDFMKMRKVTREFVMLLTTMLEHAETLTPSTVVPAGFNRIERDGIWYLGKSNVDLLILVVSKYSIMELLPSLNIPTDVS